MTVSSLESGPRQVSYTTVVTRPAEELFALVADPHRHGELDGSGTVRSTTKGPHRLSKGSKFSVNMRMVGLPYRITSTVTEFDDNRRIEWKHPLGHRWRWEFEPGPDGGTTVTETFDYSHVPGVRAKALELAGMPKKNAQGIRRTLEKLGR